MHMYLQRLRGSQIFSNGLQLPWGPESYPTQQVRQVRGERGIQTEVLGGLGEGGSEEGGVMSVGRAW